jgi:hypothetical protein
MTSRRIVLEPRQSAPHARTHWVSRAAIVGIGLLAVGSLLRPPAGPLEYALDILLRGYLMFLGTVMAHEAVHGHLGHGRAANLWWGRIALIPAMVPFTNFRKTHLLHHAFTNIPDKDPDYFVRPRHGEWAIPAMPRLAGMMPEAVRNLLVRAYLNRPWVDMGSVVFSYIPEWSGRDDRRFAMWRRSMWLGRCTNAIRWRSMASLTRERRG